jgi:predicted pyridoxine 5'-phosphate oxidase superfamily flavin-nucleotide-binding protein
MTTSSAPDPASNTQTFHEGEREVQTRVGVQDRMAGTGAKMIRDFMPEQHREFFRQLPFVIVGSIDARGQPWASVLANPPAFIESPDPRRLTVRARPLAGDPLGETLVEGASIGMLGIEPHTRRRNRLNGIVGQITEQDFTVHVRQSFGNCPKYIQARKPEYVSSVAAAPAVHRSERLDPATQQMIRRADTFFIATAHPAAPGDDARAHGVDASHRGGKPGFIRLDDDRSFTVPDFVGNFLFNTLGNIVLNPKAGLLFIDFERGDLLYLACDAEIIWDPIQIEAFKGAERLLRFRVREVRRIDASLPLRWGEAQLSPFLVRTGAWTP